MLKYDVIVVGELNADLILQDIPSFPEMGKEKLAKNMSLTMGSASAILATNIAKLNLKVGFIGKLGNDELGKIVINTLKQRNVDIRGIKINSDVKTGITVVLSFPEDYAMITHMGAMEHFSIDDIDFEYLKKATHMHFSNLYLQPTMKKKAATLFKKAKELGLTTSLDPGWDPNEDWDDDIYSVLEFVDVFMPNEQEALYIAGTDSMEEALNKFEKYCEVSIVTQGSKGSICRSEGKTIQTKVFPAQVKDTTGAGDSFNAGFLSKWINDADLKTCIRNGSACGAIATTQLGGSTASPNQIELKAFLKKNNENIFF